MSNRQTPPVKLIGLLLLALPLTAFKGCWFFGPPCEVLDYKACVADDRCEPVLDPAKAARSDCAYVEQCEFVGCRERTESAPMMCKMYCANGFKTDASGCEFCECKEATECRADADCAGGLKCLPDPTDPCNGPAVDCFRAGRMICQPAPTPCPEMMCDLWCPGGFMKDASGCDTCACNPTNAECLSDADCAPDLKCLPDATDPCNQPNIACFQRGRSTCQKPQPTCPEVMCDLWCPGGFVKDANGCDTCACNPTNAECQTDAECAAGERCQWDAATGRNVCVSADACAGLDEAACFARADCKAVYVPLPCPPGRLCPAVMVFDRCEPHA